VGGVWNWPCTDLVLESGLMIHGHRGRLAAWLFAFGAALGSASALAAPAKGEGPVTYEKKTIINFEDDTIQGDLTRPDGEYVEVRKKVSHSNLIRVREEFRSRILQSVGEL
jgi:hypothetical protein